MTDIAWIVLATLGVVVVVLQILLWVRQEAILRRQSDPSGIQKQFELIDQSLQRSEKGIREEFSPLRQEIGQRLDNFSNDTNQKIELLRNSMSESGNRLQTQMSEELDRLRNGLSQATQQAREETAKSLKEVGATVGTSVSELVASQKSQLDEIRTTLENRLTAMRDDNEKRLEQMRATVDEKLQTTLEARLSDSFKLVSDRLEQVHKGLGEMQTLAAGVGDLKRVLTNVKTRGTTGEVQLGTLLEQILTPDQFARNVATRGTQERVEFAIKLPGREPGNTCWLPVDAKFPLEDYQRIMDAAERGDSEGVESACRTLESTLKLCARSISQKYIEPPMTTDFGILFLATEGLYAEALRRPGLAEALQREYRVIVTGPSTFAAILNSLQMGFRTLAIQQRSSEVWETLGAVKTQFAKYADVLGKVQKKLQEASRTVGEAEKRTRVLRGKLRDVEALPGVALPEPTLPDADEFVAPLFAQHDADVER
jgi:DNA recombination protein RmuC